MAATDSAGFIASVLPSPPFISVPGLPNFRDAGGYEVILDSPSAPSTDGKSKTKMVRKGVLFRSSEVGLSTLYPAFRRLAGARVA